MEFVREAAAIREAIRRWVQRGLGARYPADSRRGQNLTTVSSRLAQSISRSRRRVDPGMTSDVEGGEVHPGGDAR
jgi:hypothetical protein